MNDPAASCEVSIRWNSSSYRSKLRGIRPEEIKDMSDEIIGISAICEYGDVVREKHETL